MLETGKPVKLGRQEAIILPDAIAGSEPTSDGVYVRLDGAVDGNHALWMDEAQLEKLRDSHPGVPVYGFWQVLFANGLIDLSVPQQVIPSGDGGGFFISASGGQVEESGQYRGEMILPLDVSASELPQVKVNPKRLRAPSQEALLAAELGQRQRAVSRRRYIRWGVYTAAAVGGFLLVDLILVGIEASRESTLEKLQARETTIASELGQLRATRYVPGMVPANQQEALSRLLVLSSQSSFMSLDETSFSADRWSLQVDDRAAVPEWVDEAVPEPTSTKRLIWRAPE